MRGYKIFPKFQNTFLSCLSLIEDHVFFDLIELDPEESEAGEVEAGNEARREEDVEEEMLLFHHTG